MQKASIASGLLTMGLIAAVAGPRPVPRELPASGAEADTTEVAPERMAPWMRRVTMEPIRVVVPRDERYEAVTMEPIRVVITRADSTPPQDPDTVPRR